MTIRIQLFCFIALANCCQVMSENSFLSCEFYLNNKISGVTFDCAFLDDKILHRNHFDKNVVDDSCKDLQDWYTSQPFSLAPQITLKNCRLPIMPQEFLQRLGTVAAIYFDNSGIRAINNATFSTVYSMESLSLSQNQLTELPGLLFTHSPNISDINLSRNRISHIDPNAFRGNGSKIKIINLSHNNIETIDKHLFADLKHLEVLYLGHNFIEHFHVDLFDLKDLTVLGVDNNKIIRLDCTNFDLSTNKISIDVNTNYIQDIDLNCDRHIESLEINIADNQVTHLTFPKSNLMSGLTKMLASGNLIENVLFHRSLNQLEELHLNDNMLKELVEWEDTMFPKLRQLDISGNQFNCSYLHTILKKLPRTLELERNTKRTYSYDVRKASKKIHGITCVDEVKKVYESDSTDNVLHSIKYVLAFLCVAVVLLLGLKLVKIVRKIRTRLSYHNSSQSDRVYS